MDFWERARKSYYSLGQHGSDSHPESDVRLALMWENLEQHSELQKEALRGHEACKGRGDDGSSYLDLSVGGKLDAQFPPIKCTCQSEFYSTSRIRISALRPETRDLIFQKTGQVGRSRSLEYLDLERTAIMAWESRLPTEWCWLTDCGPGPNEPFTYLQKLGLAHWGATAMIVCSYKIKPRPDTQVFKPTWIQNGLTYYFDPACDELESGWTRDLATGERGVREWICQFEQISPDDYLLCSFGDRSLSSQSNNNDLASLTASFVGHTVSRLRRKLENAD